MNQRAEDPMNARLPRTVEFRRKFVKGSHILVLYYCIAPRKEKEERYSILLLL
jgi:hypothetical protein